MPAKCERASRGSVADAYDRQIRTLLSEWPRMPAPVMAERIGWPYSLSPLKKWLAVIRPEFVGIDPADRVIYQPGDIAQCDLWFPKPTIRVGASRPANGF
jgi:hypothetical protein